MSEPTELYPTPVRLKLLADVRDLNVYEDADGNALRWVSCESVEDVTDEIREFERAKWVYQPDDTNGWRLTQRGLDVLEGRR